MSHDEKELKGTIDKVVKASHGSGRDAVSGIFDGFMELSRIVQKMGEEKAERARQRRNEKARKLYATRKQLGHPTRKPIPEPEWEKPTSCFCSTCRMPPCSWCESGAGRDEEDETG